MRLATIAALIVSPLLLLAQPRKLSPALQPYLSCRIPGGPDLIQTTPLIAPNSSRSVQTLHGDKVVQLVDGARLTWAFPGRDDLVNMKVEELPFATFPQGRADLVSNFQRLISGDEFAFPNERLPPMMQGFHIYGQDHKEVLGSVMGLYLLIDDRTHVAVTIYFLNPDSPHRNFTSVDQYAKLRDRFLAEYTTCVRENWGRTASVMFGLAESMAYR